MIQSKMYCFSENDNSQYIVSDDTKIKPHNGFTENKFILHKAKQYRKHDNWSPKIHMQQLCKNKNNISEDTSSSTSSNATFRSCYI